MNWLKQGVTWLVQLSKGSKIALVTLVIAGVVVPIYISSPSNHIVIDISGKVDGDVKPHIGDKYYGLDQETKDQIADLHQLFTAGKNFPPEESQSIEQAIASLVTSQNAEKRAISKTLATDQQQGLADLRQLQQQQNQHAQAQTYELVETNLALAALVTFINPDESLALLKQAVELLPKNLQALNQYAHLLERLGQAESAIEYYEQALGISREIKHRQGEGSFLGNLGSAYARLGQVEKAIEYYEQALDISREIKDRQGEGNRLGNLGLAYADLGQVEKAIDYAKQAEAIFIQIKSPYAEQVRGLIDELKAELANKN